MRYLILALQGLGDALEATPMVPAINEAHPGAMVDVAVSRPQPRQLFSGIRGVDQVHYLPYWESGVVAFGISLLRQSRRKSYDASFLAYPSSRPAYHVVSAAFGAKRRYAHSYFDYQVRSLQLLETVLVTISPVHNVLRNFDLLRAAGMQVTDPSGYIVPQSWTSGDSVDCARVVLHVGTTTHDGLESRRWSAERFELLASHLADEGYTPVFLSGPNEKLETEAIVQRNPRFGLFEGNLQDVAQFLGSSALVVCNDSGIAHLAAAVRAPVIALFGPTPLEHAPFGSTSHALRPSPCPPCFDPRLRNTHCALGIDFRCLKGDLTVGDVLKRAKEVLVGAGAKA